MENRSNRLYTVLRIVLGILFIPNAFIGFFMQPSDLSTNPAAVKVLEDLWASGYIMHATKIVEFIAGLMFLTNRYVQLACVLIMPIVINIVLLGLFKEPMALIVSLPMLGMVLYLAFYHLEAYRPMLKAKI